MVIVKYRKMLYCPICFSREHIGSNNFMYSTEQLKNETKIDMELTFFCSYCKTTFKLKLEEVIKR